MSAIFDGSGTGYLSRTALAATASFPFWVGIWVRLVKNPDYATTYALWASERADRSQGTDCIWSACQVSAQTSDGVSFSDADSDETIIPDPYWEFVLCEFRSTTDRRIWINNVQEGANTTSRAINLGAGSPVTRVGIRAGGLQPFNGSLASMTVGTGTLSADDRAILADVNGNYASVTGITNYYPLVSDGTDSIGGSNFTATSMTWDADVPVARAVPSRADVIDYVFKQATLRTESPTITTGQTSPIAGVANLASCEYVDCAFTGSDGDWNTRMYHLIASGSPTHLVIMDDGHSFQADWPTLRFDVAVKAVVAAGYSVLISQMPGFSPSDPTYTGSTPDHNVYWADFSPTVNPVERFFSHCVALNNLSARYAKISIAGLSGGGWLASYYPCMDPRINHAAIAVRGSTAARRRKTLADFEQNVYPVGWKIEDLWPLATPNCRLWFVNGPTDPIITAQFDDNSGNGAYLSAFAAYNAFIGGYDGAFLQPIRDDQPNADIAFLEDLGSPSVHQWSDYAITKILLPALARPWPLISGWRVATLKAA